MCGNIAYGFSSESGYKGSTLFSYMQDFLKKFLKIFFLKNLSGYGKCGTRFVVIGMVHRVTCALPNSPKRIIRLIRFRQVPKTARKGARIQPLNTSIVPDRARCPSPRKPVRVVPINAEIMPNCTKHKRKSGESSRLPRFNMKNLLTLCRLIYCEFHAKLLKNRKENASKKVKQSLPETQVWHVFRISWNRQHCAKKRAALFRQSVPHWVRVS